MSAKICIVGNGPPPEWDPETENPSAEIDACDIVMRLNYCPYYYWGWTGWKTTHLMVRSASGIHGQRLCWQYDLSIPAEVIEQGPELIVLGDTPQDCYEDAVGPFVLRYPAMKRAGHLREFLPIEAYQEKTKKAARIPAGRIPTGGAVAVVYALERWPDGELILAGFSWQIEKPHPIHDYEREQAWLRELASAGRLRAV